MRICIKCNKKFNYASRFKLYFDLSSPEPHNHDIKIDINPPTFGIHIKK